MAKFQYKMQNILEIKYKLETQAKSEYANASEQLRQEELKLKNIYADIASYEEEIRSFGTRRLDVMEWKRCKDAIKVKKEHAKQQSLRIIAAQKTLEAAREKLNNIMMERKTHERLREKAFEQFLQELNKQEGKEIDEVVSFQYNDAE